MAKGVIGREGRMQNIRFENDHFARKVMKYFLLLQIIAIILVFALIAFHLYSLALGISFTTLLIFIAIFLWLYLRYQSKPIVKEKSDLQRRVFHLQKNIREEANAIRGTKRRREGLLQDEQKENDASLINLQRDYIKQGLSSSQIKDAVIAGVGPKLKERLVTYRIFTAADISNKITDIPGFGEAKRLALLGWQAAIYAQLDRTKPAKLPNEQLENIQRKYQSLQEQNDSNEKKAEEKHQKLENDLDSLKPRLEQLAPITFSAYCGGTLASRGYVAALVAFILVATQTVSGVSAATSAMIASIPSATATPTVIRTPTNTFTPSITSTSSITLTPTITPTIRASTTTSAFLFSTATIQLGNECYIGDQVAYVYSPDRLVVLSNCVRVTGYVEAVRKESDGDLHILLKLDPQFDYLLTPANSNELGDLVVEPVCVNKPTQADAVEPCSKDPDPLTNLPTVGQYIWMEGRYVTDTDHGGWAEIHPLSRWGVEGQTVDQPPVIISANTLAVLPTSAASRARTGALCKDNTSSSATGRGACSHHGGVSCWNYSDGTCTNP